MNYRRMPIEIESPEQLGYGNIKCNLTESSFSDAVMRDLDLNLNDLVLCYGDHKGNPGLRQIIAADSDVTPDDVLVTAGACAALFIANTSLLKPGDRLVVARPNYATNIETPRAIGARIEFLDLEFEKGFRIDLAKLDRMITKDTKLVSLTCPHNPTGAIMSEEELRKVIALVEAKGCTFLFDETYREMTFTKPLPVAASLSKRAVSVSSLSKTFGIPGIRTGWLVCRESALMETFLAAKEQIVICGSVIDEEIALRYLAQRGKFLPAIRAKIEKHFGIVKRWMASRPEMEWVEPGGGVVCFPRIRTDARVDVERFYRVLNEKYKTYVGPGHWFEMDRRYMRIGYGWPKTVDFEEGLANIGRALEEARV